MNKMQLKRKPAPTENFLEKLRELGSGIGDSISQDVVQGLPKTAVNQIIGKKRDGNLSPNETLNLEKITEQEKSPQLYREFYRVRQEERLIFKQTEQKTQLQVKAIQEELKKLIESTKDLVKEIEVAAKLEPVEAGVYHLNFFERLKQTIILFRKKIETSSTWLSLFNQRSKKRNYYWAQVRKSGTKFMLSQERYMATQAG